MGQDGVGSRLHTEDAKYKPVETHEVLRSFDVPLCADNSAYSLFVPSLPTNVYKPFSSMF